MYKNIFLLLMAWCVLPHLNVFGQVPTPPPGTTIIRKTGMQSIRREGIPLDTTEIMYDEAGNPLRFYQSEKLINSGDYTISYNGQLGSRKILKKLTLQQQLAAYEQIKPFITIQGPALKEGQLLDITPLLPAIAKEDLDQKVIIMIFWDAGCPPCTESFEALNQFFMQIHNPESVTILAITTDDPATPQAKLAEKPLKYARLICYSANINNAYSLHSIPAFIVTDKSHIIRYAVKGISPVSIPAFKNIIRQVLYQ
jgi:peroxiredoxin